MRRWTVTSRAEAPVGDQQLGVRGHAGGEGALAHAAGEFVRVRLGAAFGVGHVLSCDASADLALGHDVVWVRRASLTW